MIKYLEEYLSYLELKHLSKSRIKNLRYFYLPWRRYLERTSQEINIETIKKYHSYLINEYRTRKGEPLKPVTITKIMAAIKQYCRYLYEERKHIQDISKRIEIPKKKNTGLVKNIPTVAEIERLIKKPGEDLWGLRDRAIMELMYGSGLRNKEVCGLKVYDIDLRHGQVHIRNTKNKYERIVPMTRHAVKILKGYISLLSREKNNKEWEQVFLTKNYTPMKQYIIERILKKYRTSRNITAHTLRHACAIGMLRNGASIESISELLGHRRISSTQIYTRVEIKDLKRVHRKYHPRG